MAVVVDAQRRAVLEFDARGALNLDRHRFERILDPGDLELLAVERAGLDGAPVVIGFDLLVFIKPSHSGAIGECQTGLLLTGHHEIARPPVQWSVEFRIGKTRAIHNRLVVAGEETCGFAELGNAHGPEIIFKERARLLLVAVDGSGALCALTHLAQRSVHWTAIGRAPGSQKRLAARLKGDKGGRMIVGSPAVKIGPGNRLKLSVAIAQRLKRLRLCLCGRNDAEQPQHGCDASCKRSAKAHRHRCSGSGYCPASVATSFQFGSREEMSRANVQTSVTSVTFSGLPSITLPSRSRVTETSWETKRTVTCAIWPRTSAEVMSALSIDTNRVSAVWPLLSRSRIAASKPS